MSGTRFIFFGVFVFAGVLLVLVAIIANFGEAPAPVVLSPPLPKTGTVKFACGCAKDLDSVSSVLRAYQSDDLPALAGLIARGKAIKLSSGVRVSILDREDGVDRVYVDSGFHSGERCYLWGKFIE